MIRDQLRFLSNDSAACTYALYPRWRGALLRQASRSRYALISILFLIMLALTACGTSASTNAVRPEGQGDDCRKAFDWAKEMGAE